MKKLFLIFSISLLLSNCSLLISDDIFIPNEENYPPPYKVGSKVWIENKAFGMLCRDMDQRYNDSEKLDALYRYNISLYVGQGCKILSKFRNDEYRLKALNYILPKLIKSNDNVFRLSQMFYSSSGRDDANIMISRYFKERIEDPYERRRHYDRNQPRLHNFIMDETEFNDFMESFRNKVFDNEKFNLLKHVAKRSVFSVDQCVRLMKEFTFDDERLKVCKIVVPRIVYGNDYKLFDHLNFIDSQEKLKKILEESDSLD